MIEAGRLRHEIQIQEPPLGRDSRGGRSGEWETGARVKGEIKGLTGSEVETARQLVSKATHQVTIRHIRRFQLTTKHRMVFRGRVFNIGDIKNVGELNRFDEILVSEEQP